MSIAAIINITLESLCVVICLIMIICLCFNSNTKSKLDRHFIRILLVKLALLASSITSWVFDGSSYDNAYYIIVIANFLLYFFWYVLKSDVSNYMFNYISVRTKISNKYLYAIWCFGVIFLILLIISQFTGLYYHIDANNAFHRNKLYWIAYIGPVILYFLGVVMVVQHRKSLGLRDTVTLLSYEVLPVVSLFLQIPYFGIFMLNTSSTISLLIIFIRIQMEENKRLEIELADYRINIMLSQIKPHFLYNCLVVIKQLCEIDPKAAKETVMEFSEYLRVNLDSLVMKKTISFDNELKHVENYLALEKKRFGGKLNITYDIKVRDFMLPALTLQSIAENAVRYGVTKRENGGTVKIMTDETDGNVVITVSDDGVGFNPIKLSCDKRQHVGIENVSNRLTCMCGGKLKIQSKLGVGTTAIITIPKGANHV